MSPKKTDVGARLSELEATVNGLTQELVEANERIRTLEAELEEEGSKTAADGSGVLAPEERNGHNGSGDGGTSSGGSTKGKSDDRQADEEAGSDLDDIIVA